MSIFLWSAVIILGLLVAYWIFVFSTVFALFRLLEGVEQPPIGEPEK